MNRRDLTIIEDSLKAQVDGHIISTARNYARTANRASELGLACDTWHDLAHQKPELMQLPPLPLLKIFRIGTALEKPNLRLIEDAGLKIIEQGRQFTQTKYRISGHIDAKIGVPILRNIPIPLETKTCSPGTFRMIKAMKEETGDWHGMLDSKYIFLRKYPGQLQTYELQDNSEWGAWFFFEKTAGDFFFWIAPLDLEYAESLLQRAERINADCDAGRIAEPVRKDLCDGCEFERSFCFVGKDFGPGYDFIMDIESIALWTEKLERRYELKPLASEYEDLDEEIKDFFKGRKTVVGNWLIESKGYFTTKYDLPIEVKDEIDSIKKAYAKKVEYFRTSFKKLEGELK
jgi:hypothetical protein